MYHSLDGWYLATSPKHYRVHNCYVKTTQAERLTDTIQFKHKNITNPTISPHDKIMHALANCKEALKGMMNGNPDQQMEELMTIVNNTQTHLNQQKERTLQQVPRVETQQVPRVDTNEPSQAPTRPSDTHTPNRTTGMTTSAPQPFASHCEDKPTRSNTGNEYTIQGTDDQRAPTHYLPTPTHQVQHREDQTGQRRHHTTQLATFTQQDGTKR